MKQENFRFPSILSNFNFEICLFILLNPFYEIWRWSQSTSLLRLSSYICECSGFWIMTSMRSWREWTFQAVSGNSLNHIASVRLEFESHSSEEFRDSRIFETKLFLSHWYCAPIMIKIEYVSISIFHCSSIELDIKYLKYIRNSVTLRLNRWFTQVSSSTSAKQKKREKIIWKNRDFCQVVLWEE